MDTVLFDPAFKTPCGIHIIGPTMSGKSTLTKQLIENASKMFNPPPERIVYCYSVWQKQFLSIKNCEFVLGLEKVLDESFFNPNVANLVVLDDLMDAVCENKRAASLFTQGIHHKNLSVIFLAQNLYKQGKAMRDIVLNTQYMILFKSVRDVQQIKYLAKQLGLSHLLEAYKKAIKQSYGYLVINLRPETPDILRLQSHLSEHRRVYVKT